jgi:Leucine-rich repeat (LRR) protein
MKQITHLNLTTNMIKTLGGEIAVLKSLTNLNLSNNQLSALPKGRFPNGPDFSLQNLET